MIFRDRYCFILAIAFLWGLDSTGTPKPSRSRLKNDIGKTLGEQLDTEKAAGRPVKLVRNRVAAKGARLLFRELVKGLKRQNGDYALTEAEGKPLHLSGQFYCTKLYKMEIMPIRYYKLEGKIPVAWDEAIQWHLKICTQISKLSNY
jgi:hypothetical protein